MKNLIAPFAFALLFLSCKSALSGGEVLSQTAKYVTSVVLEDYEGKPAGLTARIDDGKVFVSIDSERFENYFDQDADYRLNDTLYEVQNLDAKIVSLHIGWCGEGRADVLCMLRDDGLVQILDIWDAVTRCGCFKASWPLPGLRDIVAFKDWEQADIYDIIAVDGNGNEVAIPYDEYTMRGDYVLADSEGTRLCLSFTGDWKFVCMVFTTGQNGFVTQIDQYAGEYAIKEGNDDRDMVYYTTYTKSSMFSEESVQEPFKTQGYFLVEKFVDDNDIFVEKIRITNKEGCIIPLPFNTPVTLVKEES